MDSIVDSFHSIVARIKLSGLPICRHIEVGKLRKEDIDLRRKPGTIASRVVPYIARVEGPGSLGGIQCRVSPVEIILRFGGKQTKNAAAVRQQQDRAAIRRMEQLRGLVRMLERTDQL